MRCSQRLEKLRARLLETELEAFVARAVANVTYLTGFDGVWDDEPFSLVLVTADDATVITDSRFREAATHAVADSPFEIRVVAGDQWLAVSEMLAERGIGRVAVESSLPYAVVRHAEDAVGAEVAPVTDWIESLRTTKDAAELEQIALAQALTDDAFDHILSFVRVGMSEAQIALELEFYMRSHGSEGVAFAPIVASGPNSALPHAHPGPRLVRSGDFLKMDFGARLGGYRADMTRTVVIGTASQQQREIYNTVHSANLAGIAAARAGRTGAEIDSAARGVISAAGYGDRFGHGLGHGVGLDVHEAPTVGPRGTTQIAEGSVITIEPGIYIPGLGGVRIEDLIVVEADGARVLTRSTKELLEL